MIRKIALAVATLAALSGCVALARIGSTTRVAQCSGDSVTP